MTNPYLPRAARLAAQRHIQNAAPDLLTALKGIMAAHIGANIAEATTPALKQACKDARAAIANARPS